MDGLGGCPEVTFGGLREYLTPHKTIFCPIKNIECHQHRVNRVLETYLQVCPKEDNIFLLGQSAGGGAVRQAAAVLNGDHRIKGVILLSQSMPNLSYMTLPLLRNMVPRILDLIRARTINTTETEFARIVEPLSSELRSVIIAGRQPFPGRESQELAFYPKKLKLFKYPSLVIYGSQDKWITPRAHRKLCIELRSHSMCVESHEIRDAGHITLASTRRLEVMGKIKRWIEQF